jgi:hypothetical protein
VRPVGRKTPDSRIKALEWRTDALERRIPPSAGIYEIKVFADEGALDGNLPDTATVVSTGDGKFIFAIPIDLNTYYLTEAEAFITTVSSSGVVTVMIRNVTDAVDMLSTAITIDVGEFTSYAAAAPSVINNANSQVATGDRIAVDVDGAGTGAQGLGVILRFSPTDPS